MLKPWSDSLPPTHSMTKLPPPIRAARRRSPRRGGGRAGSPRRVSRRPTHCWNRRFRLGRGRRNSQPSAPTRASRRRSSPAPASLCWIKFFASIRRSPARCASAWRLRAATACAALARHREDSSALRDAEHLSPNAGGNAPTSPAGRIHRLWRGFAARPVGFDATKPAQGRRSARTAARPRFRGAGRGAAASLSRRRKSVGGGGARRFDDDANAGRRATRGNRDFGAVAERSDAGAKARLGCAHRPAGDDDRAAVVAVGGPPAAPGRRRLAAPLRHGRRARRAGGSWARRRSFSAIGEAVERRAKAEGERGGAGDRNAARRRRRFSGDRGESGEAVGSRQPASVRSAGRARRRARTVGAAEFSALRLVGISDEPSQKT